MAKAGYCETAYSSSAPKCVLKSPIKNICKKSCNACGMYIPQIAQLFFSSIDITLLSITFMIL